MRALYRAGITLAALALDPVIASAQIDQVNPATLTATTVAAISDVATGNHDEIVSSGGLTFAERFAGQTLSANGNFDVLSGIPTGPLTLQAGLPGQNLFLDNRGGGGGVEITGIGPLGFPNSNALGEGSIAFLFPSNQFEFGLQLEGTSGGSATFDFFRRDGSLIGEVALSNLTDRLVAFRRTGSVGDIAGVSIFHDDLGGFFFDNIRYHTVPESSSVPEPSSLVLASIGGLGLLVAGRARRRKTLRD
jgi:hypothetical protein